MDSGPGHVRKGSTSTVSTEGGDGASLKSSRDNKKGFIVNSRIKRGGGHLRLGRPGKIAAANTRPNVLTRTSSHNPNYDRHHHTHAAIPRQRSLNDLNDLHGSRVVAARTGLIPLTQRKPKLVWEEVTNDNDSTAGNIDTESIRTDPPKPESHNPPPSDSAQLKQEQPYKLHEQKPSFYPEAKRAYSESSYEVEHQNFPSVAISPSQAATGESSIKEETIHPNAISNLPPSDQHAVIPDFSDRPLAPTEMYPRYPLAAPKTPSTTQSSPVHKEALLPKSSIEHGPLTSNYQAAFHNQGQEPVPPKTLINTDPSKTVDLDAQSVTTSLPGDILTNRKFSSNVTKSPAQLYDIGASTSRTQQKLLIQRASSRFDTVEDDANTNPAKRYIHPQAKQITDSVRTNFRNVRRNREIVYEFLIKLRPFVISSEIEDFSSSSNPFTSSPHAPSSSTPGLYSENAVGFSSTSHSVNPTEILHPSQPSYPLANTHRKSIHVPKVRKGEEPETVENKILELWK
ncbi:TORC1 subunit Tco89 [Schizosaccharomyces cryophilus OY26]|uniref:TORC1 subunit Tco89 n=1 Tax=Schizosaccharomyces cryophilus (strain OY26 / ATCC MYA-4695 / CBS 11777 / NBRC 106824 / NRRL Y48691) TaxID=653667 RepID=S9XC07_SCHCR|nr:TORC1 subunit Tco89 [Schizosaccharomyces cryophilus OY26]EPY51331.1 TORC1 subunit Tco89 [Schizosaccharomyces cryophilus OY26]